MAMSSNQISLPLETPVSKHVSKRDSSLSFDQSDPRAVSMTKQSFAKECNINNIMAKYQRTGVIDHVMRVQGHYGDFTSASDYHDSMNKVIAANDMFMSLPSSIRSRFSNDPASFLDFAQNPANAAEMVKMGLSISPLVQTPPVAPQEASKGGVPPVQGVSPVS